MKQVNTTNLCSILQHHHSPPSNVSIMHVTQATSYSLYTINCVRQGASIVTHTLLTHSKLALLIASQSIPRHLTCHGTILHHGVHHTSG
jgi:hypothetical protein